ncbi:MAG: phosphatase PAP2 family protein [Clostridiales bacterium]|nr:phosphatase PAP2 family protein [Clostridiales bacterium]
MTRDAYIRMTGATRRALERLSGGSRLLRLPTLVCAAAYMLTLLLLMLARDIRLVRVLLVPAACFIVCTALRPVIGRERPYDRFDAEPVGSYKRGKGKSMPSRHTASAAAIALAVAYAYPSPMIVAAMLLLCALIASLRVLCGQHYISDVLAALLLSLAISLIGYVLI